MNIKARRRYDMLARVSAFGARRARAFPAHTLGGQMFAEIQKLVAEFGDHAVERMARDGHARERTIAKTAARRQLRDTLRALHVTARAIAIDSPGVDRRYRLPRSHGDGALLTVARACVEHAREFTAAFEAHGWSKTFVDDLAADIERFETAIHHRSTASMSRASTRVSMDAAMKAALVAVRRLDGIVPNVFREHPSTIAAWRKARRLVRQRANTQAVSRRRVRMSAVPRIRRVA